MVAAEMDPQAMEKHLLQQMQQSQHNQALMAGLGHSDLDALAGQRSQWLMNQRYGLGWLNYSQIDRQPWYLGPPGPGKGGK